MNAAIDHLERGLYYDCNNLEVNFMLGIAHMTLNSFGKALQYLGKVVELNNKFKNNLHMLLAINHKKRGDLKAALSSISSQIQLHDDH
jgi:tetratricopeptide (TPR) repeat protein